MPKDEFDLEDTNFNDGAETSLDDFFQPADKAGDKKAAKARSVDDFFAPAGDVGAKPSTENLPVSKKDMKAQAPDVFDDIKSDEPAGPETHPPPVPLGAEDEGTEAAAAAEKGFLARNWIIFLIVGLVIVLGGSGGFLAVNYFLKPKTQLAQAPAKPAPAKPKPVKPKPAVTEPAKPAPAGAETKPAPPAKPAPAGAETKPAPPAKPGAKDTLKPAEKPAPAAKPATPVPAKVPAAKPGHVPVPTSVDGQYMVQVGSYMLEASKKGPEAILADLGYTRYHYVDEQRRVKIHHLYAGKNLSRGEADTLAVKLTGMGYAPTVIPDGMGYRVEVYSYGSPGVASSTKSKLAKAGIKGLEIKNETKLVTLAQLRAGGFSTQAQAKKALADIRRGGLKGAVVIKE